MNNNQGFTSYPPQPSGIKVFFSKIWLRIKILFFLIAIWAMFYAFNSLKGSSIAIEYDNGLVNSYKNWQKAGGETENIRNKDFWKKFNSLAADDKTKFIPWLFCTSAKMFGVKVYIVCSRDEDYTEILKNRWNSFAAHIFFTPEPNDKYTILEKNKPFFYISQCDEDLIQAVKAGVRPLRLSKNKKTIGSCTYTLGLFGEKRIFLSRF